METYLPETFHSLRNISTLVIHMTIQTSVVVVLQRWIQKTGTKTIEEVLIMYTYNTYNVENVHRKSNVLHYDVHETHRFDLVKHNHIEKNLKVGRIYGICKGIWMEFVFWLCIYFELCGIYDFRQCLSWELRLT